MKGLRGQAWGNYGSRLSANACKLNSLDMLAMTTDSDSIDDGRVSVGSISRNCEKDRDAFARPVFGRFFRLVLRGDRLPFRRIAIEHPISPR